VSTGRVISLILQTGRRRLPQQELATHQWYWHASVHVSHSSPDAQLAGFIATRAGDDGAVLSSSSWVVEISLAVGACSKGLHVWILLWLCPCFMDS
jgi:hypothetical protein